MRLPFIHGGSESNFLHIFRMQLPIENLSDDIQKVEKSKIKIHSIVIFDNLNMILCIFLMKVVKSGVKIEKLSIIS